MTLTGLERWCGNTTLSDVTLAVGNRLIRAHRLVLANASPVFARMFETDMRESVTSMVRRHAASTSSDSRAASGPKLNIGRWAVG